MAETIRILENILRWLYDVRVMANVNLGMEQRDRNVAAMDHNAMVGDDATSMKMNEAALHTRQVATFV